MTFFLFQPTPSLRRATRLIMPLTACTLISTHALLAEGDRSSGRLLPGASAFQPTPSLRRATTFQSWAPPAYRNFNPRPPCGGRRDRHHRQKGPVCISTHALLAEGDADGESVDFVYINFNPRPPCGGRPEPDVRRLYTVHISTHALLAEGDVRLGPGVTGLEEFQPTPSLRRATKIMRCSHDSKSISTHALLAEGDLAYQLRQGAICILFQPTPSLRRATV